MIKTINQQDFIDAFRSSETYRDNFTYDGLCALFEHFESIEGETTLDVVAIACDYTEYESLEALKADYSDVRGIEHLCELTTVIEVLDPMRTGESFIIANF